MLTWFRKLLENWIARVFFGLLVVVFVFWGVSNVVTLIGNSTTIAHVAGKPVDLSIVQAEFQNELNQAEQKGPVDPAGRQQIAQTALATVMRQQSMAAYEQSLGIVAPDSAVRTQIDGMIAFQTLGAFDQAKFQQVLTQNNYTADRFITEVKSNIANQQLLEALTAGATPPAPLIQQIFDFVAQTRTAITASFPTSSQPTPPPPGNTTLQHYWKNHPAKYTAPEYRTIKIVVLSPAVLAPTEPVSDAQLQAAYAQVAATQKVPATRSVEVVTISDQAKAAKLAADWKGGATWAQVQAEATADGAAAVALEKQQQDQFPSAILGDAIFGAPPGVVTGPVAGTFGYFVFDVTAAVAAGAPAFAAVAPVLKTQLQLQAARQAVNQDVDNVQDALAGQTPLDKLPGDLGLAAVQGTLDANGNTLDGTPAPVPGGPDMRAAVVKAAFAGHVGDAPQLAQGPDGGYFAFTIDTITPPAVKSFASVKSQVAADWTADYLSREAEQKAAAFLNDVNGGRNFAVAAVAHGVSVVPAGPLTRGTAPVGVSAAMEQQLFGMKVGAAVMGQTTDGFMVAALTQVQQPVEADAPQEVAGIEQALAKSLQNDVAESFLAGLQAREAISVDPKIASQIYQ